MTTQAQYGRQGGLAKSPAKAKAARQNALKANPVPEDAALMTYPAGHVISNWTRSGWHYCNIELDGRIVRKRSRDEGLAVAAALDEWMK